ncbi:hypothetical protein AB2T96_15160 [Clostridium butyricum]|uniref:hypothetical protein n=1 Tax=Clostridium butyricum TaxID=1492 RepID=UPI001CA839CE|nr:hypothetical protein [Clostridium butyricum]MBZ0312518.1 hypothetical protein [Clostridium butyricum]
MGKFFRKTFDIELEDSLTYPSAKTICDTILKKQSDIEFINTDNPVSFKQLNTIYEIKVEMARGGYILICKEVK